MLAGTTFVSRRYHQPDISANFSYVDSWLSDFT
jgi:hypothetical protein